MLVGFKSRWATFLTRRCLRPNATSLKMVEMTWGVTKPSQSEHSRTPRNSARKLTFDSKPNGWKSKSVHISENEGKRIIADSLELHNVWMFQLLNDSSFLYKRFLIQYVLVEQFLSDDFLRSGRFPTRTRKSLPVSSEHSTISTLMNDFLVCQTLEITDWQTWKEDGRAQEKETEKP